MILKLENIFVVYLIKQFASRIFQFFKSWYFYGFLAFWKKLRNILAGLDYTFAVKITIRNWLQPLYQDKTFVGYLLGPIFRTGRIFVGSFIYLIIFLIWLATSLIWFLIPVFLIVKIFW